MTVESYIWLWDLRPEARPGTCISVSLSISDIMSRDSGLQTSSAEALSWELRGLEKQNKKDRARLPHACPARYTSQ